MLTQSSLYLSVSKNKAPDYVHDILLNVDYEFIAYEGAKHSFTNPDADMFGEKFGLPLAYNAEVDKQSWAKMQAFFKSLWEK